MPSVAVSDFDVQKFGFGFANSFEKSFVISTRLGKISLGQNAGLCGGMTFAALDYFSNGRPAPDILSDEIFDYLCERQTDSLDLPGGVFRYMNWQSSRNDSRMMFGKRILEGISYSTIAHEWPKVQTLLDGGHLAPLGLIKANSANPKELSKNHQVLAYGYDLNADAQILTLQVCDPNFPRDAAVTLRLGLANPDFFRPILHSSNPNDPIRGFFLSHYVQPKLPPSANGT